MTRVLIVKMSSMGDVIHTLPAITDAKRALPEIEFDWVVEPGFAEIPKWHPAVKEVVELPFRRWRKQPWQTFKQGMLGTFLRQLRQNKYDRIIDAQGLMKSALITWFAKGRSFGPDFHCAREPFASLAYQQKVRIAKVTEQHAVVRMRQLFAKVLNYPLPETPADYGIDKSKLASISYGDNVIIFLHGTTWPTKHWPQNYWQELGVLVAKAGYKILLPWGNEIEHTRAQSIYDFVKQSGAEVLPQVLPKSTLSEVTSLIAKAKGVVAVDTGLGHIAASMATPTVSLYGPTDPILTGAHGPSQVHLSSDFSCAPCLSRKCRHGPDLEIMPPCFTRLPPEKVWQALQKAISEQFVFVPSKVNVKKTHEHLDVVTE
ncbi:MAG: lipopolysaccharide heptosyltransferase I [Candidatus Berkiellales bacterium]